MSCSSTFFYISCVNMSGHYKFDARDEKVDEVQLVTNDDIYDDLPNKDEKTVFISSETSKLPVIVIIILLTVILALLVVLIGLSAFNTVQGSNPSAGNAPTSDTLTSGNNQCSCNSTQITEFLKAAQDVHQQTIYNSTNVLAQLLNWQTIYNQNNTNVLAQLLRAAISEQNNTGDAIIQLLQNIHTDQMMFSQNKHRTCRNLILQYSEKLSTKAH